MTLCALARQATCCSHRPPNPAFRHGVVSHPDDTCQPFLCIQEIGELWIGEAAVEPYDDTRVGKTGTHHRQGPSKKATRLLFGRRVAGSKHGGIQVLVRFVLETDMTE